MRTLLSGLCWHWSYKAFLRLMPFPGKQRGPKASRSKGRAQEATMTAEGCHLRSGLCILPWQRWGPCRFNVVRQKIPRSHGQRKIRLQPRILYKD